jgi:phosphoesterase RecJ-like protein
MQPIQEFYPLLTTPARVVITSHQKPDGDAMGSSLAMMHFLQKLGHQASVVSPTNWAAFLNWMPGVASVIDFDSKRQIAEKLVQEADWIICLDFNNLPRTKHLQFPIAQASAIKILIDHHEEPQVEAFQYGISIPSKSSTCEMVYDFIVESGNADLIDETIAECIYTGVMTDTGSFRFPITSAAVHSMVAFLKSRGLQHSKVHEHIYDSYLENRLRFMGHVLLNRMTVLYEYNTVLIAIPKGDLIRFGIQTGDTEGLVNYPLSILGIKMVAIVIDRDEERKWSFRSKGGVDVNTFARNFFEGGGHFNASGGRSLDSLDTTVKHFYTAIERIKSELE